MCPLYHPFMLVRRELHLLLVSLQTVGLVSQAMQARYVQQRRLLPLLVSDIRLALQLPRKRKGRARATNLHIVRKGRKLARYRPWKPCLIRSERRRATKHPKKMWQVFREDKTSTATAFDLLLCERFQTFSEWCRSTSTAFRELQVLPHWLEILTVVIEFSKRQTHFTPYTAGSDSNWLNQLDCHIVS